MNKITSLKLQDWRNTPDTAYAFEKKNIVFYGLNGSGKTNILEAIAVLAAGKSWRSTKNTDFIYNEAISAKISGMVSGDAYSLIIQSRSKQLSKNDKKITWKSHVGNIPFLLFAPEQLTLFSGLKKERQKVFDRFLCQSSRSYQESLSICERAIKQRNQLLRLDEIENAALFPWEKIISDHFPVIRKERLEFLERINPLLQDYMEELSGKDEPPSIELVGQDDLELDITKRAIEDWFTENREKEKIVRKTLLGPARDDFLFLLRNKPLTATASRGEERSVLLALLAAQKDLFVDIFNKQPIILLDDVFSELDDTRQARLESICSESQIFFTTTHEEHFQNFKGALQKIKVRAL